MGTKLPLTVRQVADVLNVRVTAVQMAIQRGRLKATKAAGAYWIEPKEVERYRRLYARKAAKDQDKSGG